MQKTMIPLLSCQPSFVYKQCGSVCPRTCQQTAFKCDNACIDGCHCPEDQFLHDGKCISQKECPCYSHGKEYKSGETIQEECNTCVCEAGAWSCTEKVCQAVCKVTGVDHFTTFDSTKFNFVGACSYTLVESLLEEDWAVFIKFSKCEQHVKLLCQKSLEIKVIYFSNINALTVAPNFQFESTEFQLSFQWGNDYITFDAGFVTLVNDKLIHSFPHVEKDIRIEMSSNVIQRVVLPNGLTVYWNGKDRIYVHAEAKLKNSVAGLCGTYNHKQSDDFRAPDGAIESDPIRFGNSWKALNICPDIDDGASARHPCEQYMELQQSGRFSK